MTVNEFRVLLSESNSVSWFNSVEVTIVYSQIDFELNLKGMSSIHNFFLKQSEGWMKLESIPGEFQASIIHFNNQINNIEQFLRNEISNVDETSLLNKWTILQNQICSDSNYFTFNSPKTKFLLSVFIKQPQSFQGAFTYITNQFRLSNKQDFIGYLFAYEFESKGESDLGKRIKVEQKSINKLKIDFQNHLNESETQLIAHLSKTSTSFKNYSALIDHFKNEKQDLFNDWFESSKLNFHSFDSDSQTKILELEKLYEEKLKLEKPAEYWKKRAEVLQVEGWKAIKWLIGLVGFACVTLYLLLWLTPEGMLLSFIKGDAQAIKWSIIYVTFISFLAFGIRALNKVAFSSFHLARDSEEREQLTYVYLSLKKDSSIEESDRLIILQSLFSRAETGLLKDESSPTMPSNIVNRIYGNTQ